MAALALFQGGVFVYRAVRREWVLTSLHAAALLTAAWACGVWAGHWCNGRPNGW